MFFFNLKKKTNNFNGGLSLKDLKKQAKKRDALILPIENSKKATKFYKIGNDVYAPVPTQNQKKPVFFKVSNITFVSQENTNGKAENRYNIAIQYKKNSGSYFYSYDLCDDKIKTNLSSKLTGAVKIEIRNKEDLYNNKPAQIQVQQPQNQRVETGLNSVRKDYLGKVVKHIDTSKKLSRAETLAVLRGISGKATQATKQEVLSKPVEQPSSERPDIIRSMMTQAKSSGRRIFVDDSQKQSYRTKIIENFEPSRFQIPQKRYFQKIKFSPEIVFAESTHKLTQAEIDDIFFFE